jgi:hypothetical protein
MSKEKTNVKSESCIRHLRVPLNAEEFDDRATQLAQALAEKQAAERGL